MAVQFAGFGNVSSVIYNEVPLFNAAAGANTLSISEEPVYSDDGSKVIGFMLNVAIEGVLVKTAGNLGAVETPGQASSVVSNNMTLEQMRRRLLQNGKSLRLAVGYGLDMDVQGADHTPKCQITNWKPLADGGRAAMFSWQCAVMLGVGTSTSQAPSAFKLVRKHFTMTFAYTESGTETRTVNGYVEAARLGHDLLPNVETLRDEGILTIDYIAGYHRRSNFVFSNNRRRLDFTVVDQQIETPHPFPAGFESVEATQTMSWRKGSGKASTASQLFSDISMSCKRFPSTQPGEAYGLFKKIVSARYATKMPLAGGSGGEHAPKQTGGNWLLQSLDAEEQLFGYTCSFSASFKCFKPISHFLVAGNMWQTLDFGGWQAWSEQRNVDANYWQRGIFGRYWNAEQDILLDVESRENDGRSNRVIIAEKSDASRAPKGKIEVGGQVPTPSVTRSSAGGQSAQPVDPQASFSRYDVYTYVLEESPVGVYGLQAGINNDVSANFNPYAYNVPNISAGINLSIVHSGGPPIYYVGLGGVIERVDHPITMPELKIFGNQQCTRVKKFIKRSTSGSMGGHPVSKLEFFALYAVAGEPKYEQIFNPAETLQTDFKNYLESMDFKP